LAGSSSSGNSSLRYLHVYGSRYFFDSASLMLDPSRTLASISRLTSLQELRLTGFIIADESDEADELEEHGFGGPALAPAGRSSLQLLLRGLPPSLRLLQLHHCSCLAARRVSLDLGLDAGVVREVVVLGCRDLDYLAAVLGRGGLMSLLLEGDTQQQEPSQQQEQQRRLGRFRINSLEEVHDKHPLSDDAMRPLQALRRSVVELEVGFLSTDVYVSAERVLQVLELQAAPQWLDINIPLYAEKEDLDDSPDVFALSVRNVRRAKDNSAQQPPPQVPLGERGEEPLHRPAASGAEVSKAAPAPSTLAPSQPASSPPPLPSMRELLQRMLVRMIAAGGTQLSSPAVAIGGGAAAATGCALPAVTSAISPVLLMKGPLMAVLAQDNDLLQQWLKTVQKRASALINGGRGGSGGEGRRCFVRYLVMPFTDAVLLECVEGTAAAVLQAATAIVQSAEGPAASIAAAAASLQVLPVVVWDAAPVDWEWDACLKYFFMTTMEQVVQEAWDAAAEAGGPDVFRRQLEWLLELRDEVVQVIPASSPLA
ncbi:hypothetical protein Agub_g9445, partial [Astrephomene gubernaculifera]